VVSYLVGSIGPVVGGFVIWAKARKFSGASASIFAFAVVSAIITLLVGGATPKVLLYKDCAATALIGLIFLGSGVVARKPVVFYMAQRYATDGTHDGMAVFDTMWDTYQEFRKGMYVSNYFWAGLFLIQAGGTALTSARRDTRPVTTTARSCRWSRPGWVSSGRSSSPATTPRKAERAAPRPKPRVAETVRCFVDSRRYGVARDDAEGQAGICGVPRRIAGCHDVRHRLPCWSTAPACPLRRALSSA
jgi:hypothetical protein